MHLQVLESRLALPEEEVRAIIGRGLEPFNSNVVQLRRIVQGTAQDLTTPHSEAEFLVVRRTARQRGGDSKNLCFTQTVVLCGSAGGPMDRNALILAALAAAGEGAGFTPVQVQKLFFLIDKEAHHLVGGPHFSFQAYDYGPFDRSVYDAIEALAPAGDTSIRLSGKYRTYGLTHQGFAKGIAAQEELSDGARSYLEQLAGWVRGQTFEQLVASIYKRYPEMKENSVFRG